MAKNVRVTWEVKPESGKEIEIRNGGDEVGYGDNVQGMWIQIMDSAACIKTEAQFKDLIESLNEAWAARKRK